MTSSKFVEIYQRYEGAHCLHLQVRIDQTHSKEEAISEQRSVHSLRLAGCLF
jgi:hypothetical protein